VRLFVAVDLTAETRRAIGDGIETLRRSMPPARWVRAGGVHATLAFLGERPAGDVDRLDAAVLPRLDALAPVTIALGGGGFFPGPQRPRVAWVGGSAEGLAAWAEAAQAAAEAVGVPREGRTFSLHLTLARIERAWPASAVERFVAEVATWRFAPFVAREMTLFESVLGAGGAVYTARRRWAIEGGS
jgi:RNA 2',3'-cyclic 3'-phosphodiesterase